MTSLFSMAAALTGQLRDCQSIKGPAAAHFPEAV